MREIICRKFCKKRYRLYIGWTQLCWKNALSTVADSWGVIYSFIEHLRSRVSRRVKGPGHHCVSRHSGCRAGGRQAAIGGLRGKTGGWMRAHSLEKIPKIRSPHPNTLETREGLITALKKNHWIRVFFNFISFCLSSCYLPFTPASLVIPKISLFSITFL